MCVDLRNGSGFSLEEFRQLGRCDDQLLGGVSDVHVTRLQDIERLGQQGWKILVVRVGGDPSFAATALPDITGHSPIRDRTTNGEGQVDPQAMDGNSTILVLTAAFVGFGRNVRRNVGYNNGRFHFVAVLAAGTATARADKFTILQQIVNGDGRRVAFRSLNHRILLLALLALLRIHHPGNCLCHGLPFFVPSHTGHCRALEREGSRLVTEALFYEDLNRGDRWTSRARTITESDVVGFAGLTGDFDPLHVDHEFAKQTPFGKPIAHGLLGLSFLAGLASQCPAVRTLAFRSLRDWQFLAPIYIGDTVHAVTEVVDKSTSGRRSGRVTWNRTLVNQDGQTVQSGIFETLVAIRDPKLLRMDQTAKRSVGQLHVVQPPVRKRA